jgi:outer membrane protein assembly factor BamB
VIWNSQVDGGPFSTPTIGSNLIYYASKTNYVTAVNASDGSLAWHYLVGKPFAPTVSPALYQTGVYIGALNKNVYALQATTGTLIWQRPIGVPITTTASIANGIIHVGLQKGSLRTLNVSNGLERWYFHTNGVIATSSPPLLAYFV